MKSIFLFLLLFISTKMFPQTADDIINKYITATGGTEKWSKVVSIKSTGNYVMGPGMLAPVNQIITVKPFKGYYFDFNWQGMTSKHAARSDSGWHYQPFGGKRETDPMSPEEFRYYHLIIDPQGLLFNYKDKGYAVEYLGTDDMEGTDVYKLRLTNKDGNMVYYYIDAETNYILKEVKRIKLKDKEEKHYITYSDFRKTDFGIILPFSSQNLDENNNAQGGPINCSRIDVNAAIDPKQFDKPKL